MQNKLRSKLRAYTYTPRVALAGHFLLLIIKGRIQKGRQKMSIFTPFSLYSILVIALEYKGIKAVAQW